MSWLIKLWYKISGCRHCGEIVDITNYKYYAYCDPELLAQRLKAYGVSAEVAAKNLGGNHQ